MLETLPGTTLHTFDFVMESGSSPALSHVSRRLDENRLDLFTAEYIAHDALSSSSTVLLHRNAGPSTRAH